MLEIQLARTALKERIEHLNRLILCSKSSGVNSPRLSLISNSGTISRTISFASSATACAAGTRFSSATTASSNSTSDSSGLGDGDDSAGGEFADGTASLSSQVHALQSDLADRNRYIAALEKRLLHARRSSHSRSASLVGINGVAGSGEGTVDSRIAERDREIEELRKRLDDKDRMVAALRSAQRRRDTAEEGAALGRRSSGESAGGGGGLGGGGGYSSSKRGSAGSA